MTNKRVLEKCNKSVYYNFVKRITPVDRLESTNNRKPEFINSIISSNINDVFCELRAHLQ